MRIYDSRFYILEVTPGISGFARPDEREYHVVTGHKARTDRYHVVSEWTPCSDESYRIEDGHLPEYQPTGDAHAVRDWLLSNPFGRAVATGKAHERLFARHFLLHV